MKRIFLFLLLFIPTLLFAQVPSDSVGAWVVSDNGMTRIKRITPRRIKGSGFVKVKAKMEFDGATSDHVFNGTAKFRMYFGNVPITEIQDLYMFSSNYSPKDFEIGEFQVKKDSRLLTGVTAKPFSSQVGASESKKVAATVTKLRDGVYDISVSGKAGEYCIMFAGAGASGFGGVFDFTLK